jgi:hypothetical protein
MRFARGKARASPALDPGGCFSRRRRRIGQRFMCRRINRGARRIIGHGSGWGDFRQGNAGVDRHRGRPLPARMDADDGSIDVAGGCFAGAQGKIPVRQKQQSKQRAAHEKEISEHGHRFHRGLALEPIVPVTGFNGKKWQSFLSLRFCLAVTRAAAKKALSGRTRRRCPPAGKRGRWPFQSRREKQENIGCCPELSGANAVICLLERFDFRKAQSTSRRSSGDPTTWRRSIFCVWLIGCARPGLPSFEQIDEIAWLARFAG